MPLFYSSEQCQKELYCIPCRQSREFRTEVSKRFEDIKEINFSCPKGKSLIFPQFPKITDQVRNALNATARIIQSVVVKKESPIVEKIERDRRLIICNRCDFYRETSFGPLCAKCACFTGLKDILKTERCPKFKW